MENIYTISLSTEIEVNEMGTGEKQCLEIKIIARELEHNEFEVVSEINVKSGPSFAMVALPDMEKKFIEFEQELTDDIRKKMILIALKKAMGSCDVQVVHFDKSFDSDDKSHLL